MIDQIFLIAAVLSSFHALTFAKWLKQNDNKAGAYFMYGIALLGIAFPAYHTYLYQ